MQQKDLIGKHFGELEVIDYNEKTKKWICLCSCGKKTEVLGYNLRLGNTKSCGHLKNKIGIKRNRTINIMDEKIGKLLVIDVNKDAKIATVKCLQCKRVSKMDMDKLIEMKKTRRKTITCGIDGCHYENPKRRNGKIKNGTKFGRLTVLERLENKIVETKKTKTSIPMYLCECDCGNQLEVQGRYLLNGRTKSCGCLKKENFIHKKKYDVSNSLTNQKLYKIFINWQQKYKQPTNLFKNKVIDKNIKFFPELKNEKDPFRSFYNWSMMNGFSLTNERIYLDRKDYSKDFNFQNCFWTDVKTKGY